jgi:hypothetical protein
MIAALFKVEVALLRHRSSAWMALATSLAVGLALPLMITGMHSNLSGQDPAQGINFLEGVQAFIGEDMAKCMGRALWARNLYLVPLLILFCAGDSMAGDRSRSQLRELLCRPVSRNQVLLGKILALGSLCGLSLLLSGLPAAAIGWAHFGEAGDLANVLAAYGLSLVSDLAVVGLALLVGTVARSAGTAAIFTLLLLLGDFFLRSALKLSEIFLPPELHDGGARLAHLLPGEALAAWSHWSQGWQAEPIVGLFAMAMGIYALLSWRFSRIAV